VIVEDEKRRMEAVAAQEGKSDCFVDLAVVGEERRPVARKSVFDRRNNDIVVK